MPRTQRLARLCELNVIEQVVNVCQTTIVADAWARGQDLTVHGVIYGLADGLLRDLGVAASSSQLELEQRRRDGAALGRRLLAAVRW